MRPHSFLKQKFGQPQLLENQIFFADIFPQHLLDIRTGEDCVVGVAAMCGGKLVGIIPEKVSTRVRKARVIVHHHGYGLHIVYHCLAGAVGLCCLCNIKSEDNTDEIIRLDLRGHKIAKRISNRNLTPV